MNMDESRSHLVWAIVQNNLPPLKITVQQILQELLDTRVQHYQTFAFLAAAFFPRIFHDRKSAPQFNALQASLFATKKGGTHQRGTFNAPGFAIGYSGREVHIDCICYKPTS